MTRNLIVICSLIVIAFAVGALVRTRPAQDLGANISGEAQAIRETILKARRIQLEAEYTFDTSQFATVYINDSRGGEITDEALAQIQLIRQDPTIRKDQVGLLDYVQVANENLKRLYDNYMAELRAKEAAGTLTEEERIILEGEMYGWPTPEPEDENAAAIATQACELFILSATAYQETEAAKPPETPAYPAPEAAPTETETNLQSAYPMPQPASPEPEQIPCPTSTPKPKIWIPHRGADPATLPPEEFEIDINSIEVEGDIARAVVHKRAVTSEYTLVKVDGQWYIAGAKSLKFTP